MQPETKKQMKNRHSGGMEIVKRKNNKRKQTARKKEHKNVSCVYGRENHRHKTYLNNCRRYM